MKGRGKNCGLTLVEMLIVIAIIVILVGMVVGTAKRIDDQGKQRLCVSTIELLGNALEQFRDFGFNYKDTDFAGLTFPLDCNGMNITMAPLSYVDLRYPLRQAIYPAGVNFTGAYSPEFSGSAALYFILSQVPDCRLTLGKIDKSLLTNTGTDKITGVNIIVTTGAGNITSPFTRIIDPWGKPLRYDYYPDFKDYIGTWPNYLLFRDTAKLTFPIITSAGPDGVFDTLDDISNRKPK